MTDLNDLRNCSVGASVFNSIIGKRLQAKPELVVLCFPILINKKRAITEPAQWCTILWGKETLAASQKVDTKTTIN